MSLAPGTRLGPYDIATSIGAGGMGEVYRARDPRLQRDVAVKVLPAHVAADSSRLHRFEQEARGDDAQPPLRVVMNWPALLQKNQTAPPQ